ncbi:hypothetical protein STEG23_022857, partial [Scotinomys teguina]
LPLLMNKVLDNLQLISFSTQTPVDSPRDVQISHSGRVQAPEQNHAFQCAQAPQKTLSPTGLCQHDQQASFSTPENSLRPHPYLSPLESSPSHSLGPRSTQTPLDQRTQVQPDDIGPRGPRSTPDVIGPGGPRSTQKPLDQEDPGVPKQH